MSIVIPPGGFVFCPLYDIPVMVIQCQNCEYRQKDQEEFLCVYEERENEQNQYPVRMLMDKLISLLEEGRKTVSKDELEEIFGLK